MDAFHLLLGRPWQNDRVILHDGRTNTYNFMFNGIKIMLLPSRQVLEKPKPAGNVTALLSLAQFNKELKES